MTGQDAVQTLRERRDYLLARIQAKQSVGWDYEYDQREHAALCWALIVLGTEEAPQLAMEL